VPYDKLSPTATGTPLFQFAAVPQSPAAGFYDLAIFIPDRRFYIVLKSGRRGCCVPVGIVPAVSIDIVTV
jgi:hypothetical protein